MGRHTLIKEEPTMHTAWITSSWFWLETLERALKSSAQFTLLTVVGTEVHVVNGLELDWYLATGVALGGFGVSVLTSIVSAPIGPDESPSVI